MESRVHEIVITDSGLIKRVRAFRLMAKYGPAGVAAITAAILAAVPTGGASLAGLSAVAFASGAGAAAAWTAPAVIAVILTGLGGTLAIGLLTDWEEVEMPGGFKLKRKSKK